MSWKTENGEVEDLKSYEIGFKSALSNEWISVKDRLPNNNVRILSFDGKGSIYDTLYINKKFFIFNFSAKPIYINDNLQFTGVANTEEDLNFEYGFRLKKITHWMPLPEPPK
jgi:hypothetical protein